MPHLPSGRAAAISLTPLLELAEQAERDRDPSALIHLEEMPQVMSLIPVLELEERSDIPAVELAEVEAPDHVKYCITQETGFSVADIAEGRSNWPTMDVAAFNRFMLTPRIAALIFERWVNLVRIRQELLQDALVRLHGSRIRDRVYFGR